MDSDMSKGSAIRKKFPDDVLRLNKDGTAPTGSPYGTVFTRKNDKRRQPTNNGRKCLS